MTIVSEHDDRRDNGEEEVGQEQEEYKLQAEALKDQGNEAFQAGNTDLAIGYFSNAIDIDPDNHVVKLQPIYYLSTITTITPFIYPMKVL
jgi:tetratricopeptide (TPR) repeat protein